MATTTIQKAVITADGEKLMMRFSFPAEKIVDGATTISFTDNNDNDTMRIQDSANGFAALSDKVGKQIEITGASNASNNFFWELRSYTDAGDITVGIRNNIDQGSMTQDRDGVTESAGSAVTISVLDDQTNVVTRGTITLGGDVSTSASVKTAPTRQDNHIVYVYVNAVIDTPVLYGETVTLTGTAGAVWELGNGQANSAFTGEACVSSSSRMIADANFGYDNCQFTSVGLPSAPYGITGAADPTTDPDLSAWYAPDLQAITAGASCGSSNTIPLEDQLGSADVTTSNASFDYVYETNAFDNGFAGFKSFQHPANGWRQYFAASGSPNWNDGTGYTVIAVARCTGPDKLTGSTINYGTSTIGVGCALNANSPSVCRPCSAATGGTQVLVSRCDGSGNGDSWINYSKLTNNRLSGNLVRFGHMGTGFIESVLGRVFVFDNAISDEKIESYVRYLLNQYNADWAPQLHVGSSGGNDSTGLGHAASPLATVQEALDRCAFDSRPHILLTEGDDIDFGSNDIVYPAPSGEGENKDQEKSDSTQTPLHPCIIRTVRTSAKEPICTLRTTADFMVNDDIPVQNMFVYGVCLRNSDKIPTNSPLRVGGDGAVNNTPTSTGKFVSSTVPTGSVFEGTLADGQSYGDYTLVTFLNCHAVGACILSVQESVDLGHLTTYQYIDVSSSHAWGTGHSLPHFLSSTCMNYHKDIVMPTPGHEPIDSLESSDIFSRGVYDQYNGPGNHIIDNFFSALDASSPIQMRNGGLVMRTSLVDASSGWTISACDGMFLDCIQDGSYRSSSSQAINWGGGVGNAASAVFDGCLWLAEFTTAGNSYCLQANNDPDNQDDNATIGSSPANQWVPLGFDWQTVAMQNCTVSNRYAKIIDLYSTRNMTVTNCLFKTPNYVLNTDLDDTSLATGGYSMTNNVIDRGDVAFANTADGDKTLSQFEALIETASGNTEESINYKYNSRSFRSYARTYLDDVSAEAEDLAYEMIRQRLAGTYNADIQYDYVYDWVRNGHYSTSHPTVGAVNSIVSLGSGTTRNPLTGNSPWGVRASALDVPNIIPHKFRSSAILTKKGWEQRLPGTNPDKGLTEVIIAGNFGVESGSNEAPYFFEGVNPLTRTLSGVSGSPIKPFIIEIVDPDKMIKGDSVSVSSTANLPDGLSVVKMSLNSPLEIFAIVGTPTSSGSDELTIVFTDGDASITAMIDYNIV